MAVDCRTVHAVLAGGCEIVRYNRAGKWYAEWSQGREALTLGQAVRLATSHGAKPILGQYGGRAFDRGVRKALERVPVTANVSYWIGPE